MILTEPGTPNSLISNDESSTYVSLIVKRFNSDRVNFEAKSILNLFTVTTQTAS